MNNKIDSKNLRKQLEIIGVDAIGFITKILVEKDKQVTGNLIKSLDFKIVQQTNDLMLEILAAPYYSVVDKGRKPGKMPPIKPIQKWVDRKGIKFKNMSQGQTAFVIARSIGKKGIKGIDVTNKLIKEIIQNKEKLIKQGAIDDINEFIQDFIVTPLNKEFK